MPPLPINREDGGQTQLQEQNGVVSAVPQPTYPAINIPEVITPDFFNRPPSADRQRIENDLQTRRQEYMTSFQQTQREQQLQQEAGDLETQLTNLRQSEAKGQFNIEQQRIAMPLITGQQAALQRQAQLERGDVLAQLESKQRSLGFEVAKREGLMAKAKAAIGFAESDLDRIGKLEQNQFEREKTVLDYAQKLGDNARNTLGTILSKFEGMGWNDLSEQARTGLANLAAQAGIDPFIIAQGLETQKDSMLLKRQKEELEMGLKQKQFGLDVQQQEFSQKLASQKFEEDKKQFGQEYALRLANQNLTERKLSEDIRQFNEKQTGEGLIDPAQLIAYGQQYASTGKIPTGLPKGTFGVVSAYAKELPKENGVIVDKNTGTAPDSAETLINAMSAIYSATELAKQLKELDKQRVTGLLAATTGKVFGSSAQQKYIDLKQQIVDLLARARTGAAMTANEEKFYGEMLPGRVGQIGGLIGVDPQVRIDNFINNLSKDLKNKAAVRGWAIQGLSTVKLNGKEYTVGQEIEINGVRGRILPDGSISMQ